MNNQTNNENLSQGTNGQPDEYSAYRDEEYERMRIEMEKRRAERRAREHRRVMKNRIIAIAILLVIIFVIVKACGGKSDNKPAADSKRKMQPASSIPGMEHDMQPEPTVSIRPRTVGPCQVRAQLSTLWVPMHARVNFCMT